MSYFCFMLMRRLSEGENPVIKRSHLIATVLGISAIVFIVSTLFIHRDDNNNNGPANVISVEFCTSDICKAEANRISNNIKPRVNPCDNFYDFACGGWIARHSLPPGEYSWNLFKDTRNITTYRVKEILEKNDKQEDIASIKSARNFYRTCLATYANIQPSFDVFLKELSIPGGWPMVSNNWESDKFDWQSLVVEIERTLEDVSPLFKIDVMRNPKNTSRFVLFLGPSSSPDLCKELRKIESLDGLSLEHPLTATAHLLSHYTNETFLESADENDDTLTLKFAKKFCEITKKEFVHTDSDPYPSTTLGDLQVMTDELSLTKSSSRVHWEMLLREYMRGSGVHFTADDVLIVQSDVILDVIKLIDETPERTLANYIYLHKVRWIKTIYSEDAALDRKSQEESCISQTRQVFPHAIGREYTQLYSNKDDLKEVTRFMKQLLSYYINNIFINAKTWLDSTTRSTAVYKAHNMIYVVGYPGWYKNTSKINEMYSKIQVGDSHIKNVENSKLGSILYRLQFLREKADPTLFVKGATETSAAYSVANNLLQIPAGMIQPPFYVRERPPALNFGSLISLVAHEITHAFDMEGRQRDQNGNIANWWSKDAQDAYTKKAECFENQYSHYYIRELEGLAEKHRFLDGFKALSENMADNGGLEAAFGAFKKNYKDVYEDTRLYDLSQYTPEQLFYIGYASNLCETSSRQSIVTSVLFDAYSPSKYRALIPLTNSEEFSTAWNCPSGRSNMNNKPRCHFWARDKPKQDEKAFMDFKASIDASLDKLINETIQKINKGGIYAVTRVSNNSGSP